MNEVNTKLLGDMFYFTHHRERLTIACNYNGVCTGQGCSEADTVFYEGVFYGTVSHDWFGKLIAHCLRWHSDRLGVEL